MLKYVAAITSAFALALALMASPAAAYDYGYNHSERNRGDWEKNTRFFGSVGFDTSGLINFLTFRDGPSKSGWNWQLGVSYQLQEPVFVEGGLMGWTLGRENRDDAKEFSIAGSVGVKFKATEFGVGFVPSGGRVFARRFFEDTGRGKGTYGQVDLVFPSVTGARSFLGLSVGYGF